MPYPGQVGGTPHSQAGYPGSAPPPANNPLYGQQPSPYGPGPVYGHPSPAAPYSPYGQQPPMGYAAQPPPMAYAQPSPMGYAQSPTGYAQSAQNVQVETSTCTGNKKSLLIGINYFRQRGELKGCINDVHNMRKFISERFRFPTSPSNMVILTDDQQDPNFQPTALNIVNAMKWLVGGAHAGDSLFFHYSGHGGQVRDKDGDEADGMDSALYPVDYARAGPLLDDLVHDIMVKHLPHGVRLTVIMDCCHAGTICDLPYTYASDGSLKKYSPVKAIAGKLKSSRNQLMRGDAVGAAFSLVGNIMNVATGNQARAEEITKATKTTFADVIMFAGCKDEQTSADSFVSGFGATGAMSYALIHALSNSTQQQTYLSLLANVRAILINKYSQKPQLSTGRPMDMNSYFMM